MAKFYWLKLKADFYKRHDVKVIESMPNGVEYMWFYMKLMMESATHEGALRFSELIPYNDNMLATITGTNIDVVRGAMKVFIQLGMIEVLDDETIYIEAVAKMIGSEASSTERVRKHREQKQIEFATEPEKVKEPKEIKHKYGEYKHVLLTDAELDRLKKDYPNVDMAKLIEYFDKYIEEKGYKSKNHNLAIRRWVIEAFTKKPFGAKQTRVEQVTTYAPIEVEEMSDEEAKRLMEEFNGLS